MTPTTRGADAAAAVVNTNLATAAGVITWIAMDAWLSKERKPTFLGGVNGMICGLVGITPCAGWVNGYGAMLIGLICSVGRVGGLELPLEGGRHSRRWTTRSVWSTRTGWRASSEVCYSAC